MKEQTVVRTYPSNYANPTSSLAQLLKSGWYVIMSTPFDCKNQKGTEYILERIKD
jgi:hypothetical protein